MLSALLLGAVAASSLVIGAVLGVLRQWDDRLIGAVLGFGAGAYL
jgi:ZIP family zinc transporter